MKEALKVEITKQIGLIDSAELIPLLESYNLGADIQMDKHIISFPANLVKDIEKLKEQLRTLSKVGRLFPVSIVKNRIHINTHTLSISSLRHGSFRESRIEEGSYFSMSEEHSEFSSIAKSDIGPTTGLIANRIRESLNADVHGSPKLGQQNPKRKLEKVSLQQQMCGSKEAKKEVAGEVVSINSQQKINFDISNEIYFEELSINSMGDTPLHDCVRQSDNPDDLRLLLEKTSKIDAAIMAKTVNNQGKIPHEVLMERKLSAEKEEQFLKFLTPPTIDIVPPAKPFSSKIDITEVLNKYKPSPGSLLEYHLQLGAEIINRCVIPGFQSSTHLDANSDPIKAKEVQDKIEELETEAFKRIEIKMTSLLDTIDLPAPPKESKDKLPELLVHFSNELQNEIIKISTIPFIDNNMGNCHHLSWLGLTKLKSITDLITNIEVISITNGGHVFIVLGRNPNVSFNNYSEWGSSAVLVDPWARTVAPIKFIRPATHKCIFIKENYKERPFNLITSYNPRFHNMGIAKYSFNYREKREISFYFRMCTKLTLSDAVLLENFKDIENIDFKRFVLWKEKLVKKSQTETLKNNSLLVKFYLEIEVNDRIAIIRNIKKTYNRKSLAYVCNVLLYAILHDDDTVFLQNKLLTGNFNLLIRFAAVFNARKYLSMAYQLHLVDTTETLEALTIAVLQKDCELMNFILNRAIKSDITVKKLEAVIHEMHARDLINSPNPIYWAVASGFSNGLKLLQAAGFTVIKIISDYPKVTEQKAEMKHVRMEVDNNESSAQSTSITKNPYHSFSISEPSPSNATSEVLPSVPLHMAAINK